MGIYDDPIEPHSVEALRRSIAMLAPGQVASLERTRALALLSELQRLQHEHRHIVTQLRVLLGRLDA